VRDERRFVIVVGVHAQQHRQTALGG
jgi:hypothetical protein